MSRWLCLLLVTDVSGKHIGLIFKGKRDKKCRLTRDDGNNGYGKTLVANYQTAQRDIPVQLRCLYITS